MRGSFFGLNVALRGLYTSQRNLDVINHNISNVNTPGYSKQVTNQVASRPIPLLNGTGMLGTGSEVISIERVRDEYLILNTGVKAHLMSGRQKDSII